MTKPHEEDWDNGRDFEVTVCGPELDRDIDAPREVMARAAPSLARALLRIMGACANTGSRTRDCFSEGIGPCPSCDCKAALRKAGVLT